MQGLSLLTFLKANFTCIRRMNEKLYKKKKIEISELQYNSGYIDCKNWIITWNLIQARV